MQAATQNNLKINMEDYQHKISNEVNTDKKTNLTQYTRPVGHERERTLGIAFNEHVSRIPYIHLCQVTRHLLDNCCDPNVIIEFLWVTAAFMLSTLQLSERYKEILKTFAAGLKKEQSYAGNILKLRNLLNY